MIHVVVAHGRRLSGGNEVSLLPLTLIHGLMVIDDWRVAKAFSYTALVLNTTFALPLHNGNIVGESKW